MTLNVQIKVVELRTRTQLPRDHQGQISARTPPPVAPSIT